MAKHKVKPEKAGTAAPSEAQVPDAVLPDAAPAEAPENIEPAEAAAPVKTLPRWRRLLPDLIKVAAALTVVGVAALIWYQPPLVVSDFPHVSYHFDGSRFEDAILYRPLAMPTRYYVALPQKLADKYEWFAVDRRREVVALAEAPSRRGLGRLAIRRSDPLGLDLEFRKLDGSEWQIFFFDTAIVFSNAVLCVRLDTEKEELASNE